MIRVAGLVVAALALRILLLPAGDLVPFGDAFDYDRHGIFIARDGVFPPTLFADPGGPSALRPPAFPFLLGGIYEVFGISDWTAARVVMALLGAVSVLLTYGLVATVWDRRRGLVAAGIATVLPVLAVMPSSLLSENLFVPLTLGVALLVALQRERGGWWLGLAAGAVLGLAVSTRTNGLLLLVPVVVGLWPSGRRAPIAAVAGVALVLTPWTIRNLDVFDRFLPLGTQSGYTMAGVYNGPSATPSDNRAAWTLPQSVQAYADLFGKPGTDEGDIDAELRSRALDYVTDHPTVPATTLAINVERTLHLPLLHNTLDDVSFTELGAARWSWPLLRIGAWVLFALTALAVVLRTVRREQLWLWLFPVTLLAGYILWLGLPRYRVPVDAFLVIPAALAVVTLWERRRA